MASSETIQRAHHDCTGLVTIGSDAWDELYPHARPDELTSFPAQQQGQRVAPDPPFDLFFQLRSFK